MNNGVPIEVNLDTSNWCSTTEVQSADVEPGVFELITETSIYRLRLLSHEEKNVVWDAVEQAFRKVLELQFTRQLEMEPPGMMS